MTEEELVEVQEWMSNAESITVEYDTIDIQKWRLSLSEEELAARIGRMDRDLRRVMSMIEKGNEDRKIKRRRRLAAKRRIVDDDEDE